MKKKFFSLFAVLVALMMVFSAVTVSAATEIKVVVDGKQVDFPDAKPFIDKSGRVQVPIRFLAESLGLNVAWNEANKEVAFTKDKTQITMRVGDVWYDLNGFGYSMDTAPIQKDGRVYAPLRFVSQAFGAEVKWDSKTSTVTVIGKSSDEEVEQIGLEVAGGFILYEDSWVGFVGEDPDTGALGTFFIKLDPEIYTEDQIRIQKQDLEAVLLQQMDESTVKTIIETAESLFAEHDNIADVKRVFVPDIKNNRQVVVWYDPAAKGVVNVTIYKEGLTQEDIKFE